MATALGKRMQAYKTIVRLCGRFVAAYIVRMSGVLKKCNIELIPRTEAVLCTHANLVEYCIMRHVLTSDDLLDNCC